MVLRDWLSSHSSSIGSLVESSDAGIETGQEDTESASLISSAKGSGVSLSTDGICKVFIFYYKHTISNDLTYKQTHKKILKCENDSKV